MNRQACRLVLYQGVKVNRVLPYATTANAHCREDADQFLIELETSEALASITMILI
jgi:hypothetical protein